MAKKKIDATDEKKTELIQVRITEAKKASYVAAAKDEGRTLSNWIERVLDLELERP